MLPWAFSEWMGSCVRWRCAAQCVDHLVFRQIMLGLVLCLNVASHSCFSCKVVPGWKNNLNLLKLNRNCYQRPLIISAPIFPNNNAKLDCSHYNQQSYLHCQCIRLMDTPMDSVWCGVLGIYDHLLDILYRVCAMIFCLKIFLFNNLKSYLK